MLLDVRHLILRPAILSLTLVLCILPANAQTDGGRSLFDEGNAAMRRGDANQAIRSFTEFTHLQPSSAIGFFNLGLAFEQRGNLEQTLTALHKAQTIQPSLRGVRLFTGIVDYKLNHLADAYNALIHATQLEPRNASAWMWLGVVELAQSHPETAAAALDKAARLDPGNVDILYHRGRAHLLLSKQSYEEMFKLDPDSWRVHEVVGQADTEASRSEDAITEFTLAVNAAPHEPGLHEELGDAYWTSFKLQEAAAAYTEEIKIDPANTIAVYKLGSLFITRNDAAAGVPLLRQALATDPELNDAHYYLGKGEAALGQYDAAIEQLHLATSEKNTEDMRIVSCYQLFMVYRKTQRSREAADALANFRQMKSVRDTRQQNKLDAPEKRREQLPVQEAIPVEAGTPPS